MRTLVLSEEEVEDLRYALARQADLNDHLADGAEGLNLGRALLEQARRFRKLAKKVTS